MNNKNEENNFSPNPLFKIDQKFNFEEQNISREKLLRDLTFYVRQKRCALTRINVPNFCYFYKKNTMFPGWKMQKLRDFHKKTNIDFFFLLPITEHNFFCAYFWFPIFFFFWCSLLGFTKSKLFLTEIFPIEI